MCRSTRHWAFGLTPDFQNVEFPQLIPQIVTARGDMIITAFSDKIERQGQLDFIDYFKTGNVFYSATDHQADIKAESDLCDKTVAVATGRSWVTWAENVGQENCATDKPVTVIKIPTQAEHIMQIRQGRAQASVIGLEGLLDDQTDCPSGRDVLVAVLRLLVAVGERAFVVWSPPHRERAAARRRQSLACSSYG